MRSIGEAKEREEFTRKIDDVREADFRLANRRLQPLGHLTDAASIRLTTSCGKETVPREALRDTQRRQLHAKTPPDRTQRFFCDTAV